MFAEPQNRIADNQHPRVNTIRKIRKIILFFKISSSSEWVVASSFYVIKAVGY
jgi:hypothetical protein